MGVGAATLALLAFPQIDPIWDSCCGQAAAENPGAGQEDRALPGGPSVVTEGYIRARPLPPTLVTKTGGPPSHFLFTEAPVIYSVSCV